MIRSPTSFVERYLFGPDGKKNLTHEQWLGIFDRTVKNVKDELMAENRGDEFFGAKVMTVLWNDSYPC